MKAFLFVLMLLFFAPAYAQTPGVCEGYSTDGPSAITTRAVTEPIVPCLPDTFGGTGQGWGMTTTLGGVVAWVYCPTTTGWQLRYGVRTHGELAQELPRYLLALADSDALNSVNDVADMSDIRPVESPEYKAIWCPSWRKMVNARPTTVSPLAAQWRVRKAPLNANPAGTRPAYTKIEGDPPSMRATLVRVREYTACECNRATQVLGTATYCAYVQSGPLYALCERTP